MKDRPKINQKVETYQTADGWIMRRFRVVLGWMVQLVPGDHSTSEWTFISDPVADWKLDEIK